LHSSLLPDFSGEFFYLPDFSALWGHFFSIARKKWAFDRLRRRLAETTKRRRSQLFACVRRPSRYDEPEIHDERRSGAARQTARYSRAERHEEGVNALRTGDQGGGHGRQR
jgi:hypothetical protein